LQSHPVVTILVTAFVLTIPEAVVVALGDRVRLAELVAEVKALPRISTEGAVYPVLLAAIFWDDLDSAWTEITGQVFDTAGWPGLAILTSPKYAWSCSKSAGLSG
jgi:hypothetical protein